MNGHSQRSSKPLPTAIHRHKEVDGRKAAASSSTCETSLSKHRQGRNGFLVMLMGSSMQAYTEKALGQDLTSLHETDSRKVAAKRAARRATP
uniref:Uncharacterized protein n=1 Tax=Trichuris muris TaxID=70415 RepID=A0A5S6QN82_TRIMR